MIGRSFVVALLATISVLVPPKPAAAQTATGPPCASRTQVVAFLLQVVGERLVGSGLSSGGVRIDATIPKTVASAPHGRLPIR